MLELGSSGSVRGVSSNGHSYRNPRWKEDIRTRFLRELHDCFASVLNSDAHSCSNVV